MARKSKHIPSVPSAILPSTGKLNFSFEYYDKTSDKYCISCWTKEQIRTAFARLQEICTKSFNQLSKEGRVYHFSEVDWTKTIEKSGFHDSRVNDLQAFHFALLNVNGQKARVYGAYSSGTFYIVWFDLNHEIWSSPLKRT